MTGIVPKLVCAAVRQLALINFRVNVHMGVVDDGQDSTESVIFVRNALSQHTIMLLSVEIILV